MIRIFLLILPVTFCAEKCEDLVIDLHNGTYVRENVIFDLNQTCQYTFIIPDDSIAYVDLISNNIFDSWYELESSAGDKYIPDDYIQRDRYDFPPPYFYLRFYLVGENEGYNPLFSRIVAEPWPLPFSAAMIFDLRKEMALVPIIRYQGANVLKFIGEEGVVLHVIPPMYDHIDQWRRIFVMNGTKLGGQMIGNAGSLVGSTVFYHNITVFYDDLNFGAFTAGSTSVIAAIDRKGEFSIAIKIKTSAVYSQYGQFYVEPATTKTFSLDARHKPCGVTFASQSSSTYGVRVTSFFLLPFDMPKNGVLYIYGGLPFRNNSNILHTIMSETLSSFTFPMIFNGYIYSFVLHNASISLPFATAYDVDEYPFIEMNLTLTDGNYSLLQPNEKTGYTFKSEEEHLYYMSIDGLGSSFALEVSGSMHGFDGRDGILNYTTTELFIIQVTPSAILTITSGAEETVLLLAFCFTYITING